MRQRRRGAVGGGVVVVLGVVAVLLGAILMLRRPSASSGAPDGAPSAVAGQADRQPPASGRERRGRGRRVAGASDPASAAEGDPAALRAARPPILPDTTMTPGAALDVTAQDICVPGYSKRVRNVPSAVKQQAYAEYGIASHQPGEYEVDHLISLELGGSNAIANLWPESFQTQPWNAHVKDRLENELHRLVCAGQLDLATAQEEIAGDWVAAYLKRFGAPPSGG